jgi:2-oxoglutarate/2-oxoacid ferredoxin oxidoreductase subunit beta
MTDNILNDPQSLDTHIRPTWCAGCGNFSIWLALKQSLTKLNLPLEKIVLVYDIGCSGNMADFNKSYAIHALHGRAIPPAVGVKLANSDLKVIVVIGDGGGYGEGLTHYLNEMRGNHDVSIFVHNNHRYSLTTGQMSPTTAKGTKTKSTPFGAIEEELNPIALAISNHATFVAREFAVDVPSLINTMVNAINHPGFSVIDILQPCLVFNPEMDAMWYRQHTQKLEQLGYTQTDRGAAWQQAVRQDVLPLGVFWQDQASVPYHQADLTLKNGPLISHALSNINIAPLLTQFQ